MISVVIPAYNEELSILDTITQIVNILNNKFIDYEIIIVNDGSNDNTNNILMNLPIELNTHVNIINHPHNIGYGKSLKDGIIQAKYDTIIITDADQTYPFQYIDSLLEAYNKGFDMVVAAREGKHYRESLIKAPLRKILKFLVEFTAGRTIPDINSGFRVFSKQCVINYMNHLCNTFSFTTSLTLAYMMTSRYVHYVPINYEKRSGVTKVRLFHDSIRTLQYILQAINYYNPLKIFILFAIICIILSIIGFLMSAIFGLKSGFLLGIGGLLVTLIIISIGLLADLLKQIMNQQKK
jgi:polyisoprenyl-phosphate glycosyltransferase